MPTKKELIADASKKSSLSEEQWALLENWENHSIEAGSIVKDIKVMGVPMTRHLLELKDLQAKLLCEEAVKVEKERIFKIISKAYYIDKHFSLDDPENLKSLEGDIVLAFPANTKEIITLWCDSQNSLSEPPKE